MLKDKDIREPLFMFLEEQYGKVRILEEKMMGRSRADVIMVIENELIGIEIKSDADTYVRLSRQVKDYDCYFDRNIIVVGTSHATHVKEHVPEHWGIITVEEAEDADGGDTGNTGNLDFYFYRRPEVNPDADITKRLPFLWRPELNQLLLKYEMPAYAYLSKPKVIEKILIKRADDLEGLKHDISELLFERDYDAMLKEIEEYRATHSTRRRRGRKKSTRVRAIRRAAK